MKLKRKEFADLKQGGMTVNEYLYSFIQLSRYAPNDIDTDEKKQDAFLNGLNDDIQFQLLNTDYADFQHVVDKAIVVVNKIREMEKDGGRSTSCRSQVLCCSEHHSGRTARAYRCSPDRTRNRYPAPQCNLRIVRRTKEVKVWGPVSSVA
jgi:hypothetical protein